MLVDLSFYIGTRQVAEGKWPFVPSLGTWLRLELRDGAEVLQVEAVEAVGVHSVRSRSGPLPNLHLGAVRVILAPVASVPDSPAGLGV